MCFVVFCEVLCGVVTFCWLLLCFVWLFYGFCVFLVPLFFLFLVTLFLSFLGTHFGPFLLLDSVLFLAPQYGARRGAGFGPPFLRGAVAEGGN